MSVADRATVANMSPENGATITYFPVDNKTLDYLRLSGRTEEQVELVEAYCKANGLFIRMMPIPLVIQRLLSLACQA